MLNNCVFEGRLVRDPVYQTTGSGEYAQFTLAVKRSYKNSKTGEYDADYIDCCAFQQRARFLKEHCGQGDLISITGTLETRTKTNDAGFKYTKYTVIVSPYDQLNLCVKKGAKQQAVDEDLADRASSYGTSEKPQTSSTPTGPKYENAKPAEEKPAEYPKEEVKTESKPEPKPEPKSEPVDDTDTAGVLPWEGDEDSGDTGDSGSDNVFQI